MKLWFSERALYCSSYAVGEYPYVNEWYKISCMVVIKINFNLVLGCNDIKCSKTLLFHLMASITISNIYHFRWECCHHICHLRAWRESERQFVYRKWMSFCYRVEPMEIISFETIHLPYRQMCACILFHWKYWSWGSEIEREKFQRAFVAKMLR